MPQITVDYSASLDTVLDRRRFALELHPMTAELIDTTAGNCRTRFRRVEETVVGDGAPGQAFVHVEMAILAGRSEPLKAELAQAVADLLGKHTASAAELTVHASVEVRDLSAAYRKPRADA
ncbi:5-carboxymethyl-2-hydroxymuconate Delta-isomerase [Streptomyces luteireticuli]|uniref:5-carboxymethyl-2-hydroxymuconate Delta-isomerase n=1 Tax=Streptomyces luteireticuli TaxID=173858 RepID=UPI0035578724